MIIKPTSPIPEQLESLHFGISGQRKIAEVGFRLRRRGERWDSNRPRGEEMGAEWELFLKQSHMFCYCVFHQMAWPDFPLPPYTGPEPHLTVWEEISSLLSLTRNAFLFSVRTPLINHGGQTFVLMTQLHSYLRVCCQLWGIEAHVKDRLSPSSLDVSPC